MLTGRRAVSGSMVDFDPKSTKPMEGTVKARLLFTSALFLFVQMPMMQAQVTVDVSKITCEQVLMEKLAWTEREVELWLSGYYHGKRNDTIVEPEAVKKNEEKLNRYCYEHRDTTVMDAVKNVLGWDK
jgi:acid stress chaperone HdeB